MQKEFAVALLDVPVDAPGAIREPDSLQYTRYPLRRYSYASARHGCDALLSRVFVCHYVPTARDDIEYLRASCPQRPFVLIANRVHSDTIRWATALRIHDLFALPQELPQLHRLLDSFCEVGALCAQDGSPRCRNYYTSGCAAKWRTLPAVMHVHRHYERRVCVAELAKLCSMSESTFYRAFKEEQGMAFSDYLMCLRVHVAKLMLRHTALSVAEVAAAVGFCDASHFGKAFRAVERLTPSDYRLRTAS